MPLLARSIWIKKDQCFPGRLPALARCTGVPAVAEQGTVKPLCLFQLHKEPSSSLPCHMALLLIPWKRQGCGGWMRGCSSLNISPARAYAEVLALTQQSTQGHLGLARLGSLCHRGSPSCSPPAVLLAHMCCKLFSNDKIRGIAHLLSFQLCVTGSKDVRSLCFNYAFWSNVVQMAISSQPLYLFMAFLFNLPKTNTHL